MFSRAFGAASAVAFLLTSAPFARASPPVGEAKATVIGWAELDRDAKDPRACVLALHVADGEYDGISSLSREKQDDGESHVVPQGDARLPPRLRPGGLATVISKRGLSEVVYETFEVYSEEGNTFLTAGARTTGKKAEFGLLVTGAPHPKARLQAARGKKVSAKEANKLLDAVVATATEDTRDDLAKTPLTTKDLQLLDAHAPGGGRLLLAKQLVRPALDGAPAFWNVGLFLVSADGTLTSLSESGLHNSAGFDVTWRTDIDGDGIDELVLDTEWAEGSLSRDVLVWDGAKYVTVDF
ncbi:MAG: hypothetical protein IV100_30365 [Myxococcales bacterium]|nr:hypothetical protein [Myxococcales bacterium]